MDSQDAYSNTQHLIDDATEHIHMALGALHEIVSGEYCKHAGFADLFEGLDKDAQRRVGFYTTHERVRWLRKELRYLITFLWRYQQSMIDLDQEAQDAYAKRQEASR